MVNTSMQQALFHGSGEFCGVVLLAANPGADMKPAAMKLLALTQLRGRADSGYPANLYLLVGLKPSLLTGLPMTAELSPPRPFVNQPADVVVQIAASTAADRALGLRLVAECFQDVAEAQTVQGARLLNSQENFGFADGSAITAEQVAERIGTASEGTWLFHQTIRQDVRRFLPLTDAQKVEVLGRVPSNLFGHAEKNSSELDLRAHLTNAAQQLPADHRSHYRTMTRTPLLMVRRGFPYQECGHEGLVFLAAAASPQVFGDALQLMSGSGGSADALLEYVQPTDGGLYFCPSPQWFVSTAMPTDLPAIAKSLRHDVPLLSYTTTEAFILWMLEMRERGVFEPAPPGLAATLRADLQPDIDAIYSKLNGIDPLNKLKALQQSAERDAGEINQTLDDYLTFN